MSHDPAAETITLRCDECGCEVELRSGEEGPTLARECLVCPVCWAVGPSLEDAAAQSEEIPLAPLKFRRSPSYRIMGCVNPHGPELSASPREMRELARLLWRLAGETAG